jgi:hypothetical protein
MVGSRYFQYICPIFEARSRLLWIRLHLAIHFGASDPRYSMTLFRHLMANAKAFDTVPGDRYRVTQADKRPSLDFS